MGRLWESFKDKCEELVSTPAPIVTPEVVLTPPAPMRAYRDEALSDNQRHDLLAIVNEPGYEVLLDLHESTLEGFITYLVETPVEDEKKVLALHKLCHAGYLFNRSVMKQVEAYKTIEYAENSEALAIKAAMKPQSGDPLLDLDILKKVLDPTYSTPPTELKPKPSRNTDSPLDTMLNSRE